MKHFLFALVILLSPLSVSAQDERTSAIRQTIQSQFDAFKSGDFDQAFNFASPGIQSFFRNAENFEQMVRRGYPMVVGPENVDFLPLRDEAGNLIQRVIVRDRIGGVHVLDYLMVLEANGWRINGVTLLEEISESA